MIPFTYLIGWSKHNIWYYGVRYGKNCKPADLWKTYYTSSKYVHEFRKLNGEPDILQIRMIFKDSRTAIKCEDRIIRKLKLYENPNFLNKSYSGSIYYDEEVRKKISEAAKGRPAPHLKNKTPEHVKKIQRTKTGVKLSDEHKKSLSLSLKERYKEKQHHCIGKKLSDNHKSNISNGVKTSEKWNKSKDKMIKKGEFNGMYGKKHNLGTVEKLKKAALNRPKVCCIFCHKPKQIDQIHDGIPVSNFSQHHFNCV